MERHDSRWCNGMKKNSKKSGGVEGFVDCMWNILFCNILKEGINGRYYA